MAAVVLALATVPAATGAVQASAPSPSAASEAPQARATATPTDIKFTPLGGAGGWKVTWKAVAGASSYVVSTPAQSTVKSTTNSATIQDLGDDRRRQSLILQISVTAYSSAGGPSNPAYAKTPCAPAYLYAARGSGQPMGAGAQGLAVAKKVRSNLGSRSVTQLPLLYVPYEAVAVGEALKDPKKYSDSVAFGVALAADFFKNFSAICPSSTLIPFGFSQGADVMGTTIARKDVAATIQERVGKIFLMADPRRNNAERSIVQRPRTYSTGGILGDRPLLPDGVWQKTQSWCDVNDSVCHPASKGAQWNHSQAGPTEYIVDCISWYTEGTLQNRYTWNKRTLPKACNGYE